MQDCLGFLGMYWQVAPDRRRRDAERSPELIARKAKISNGGAVPVEFIDVGGALFAHELISGEEMLALRLLASWLTQFRRRSGSVRRRSTGCGRRSLQARAAGPWSRRPAATAHCSG
jgi:hypothetical protein